MDSIADRRHVSFYAVLGLRPHASNSDIRAAYKKLAMKWHPDRWSSKDTAMAEEAKRKFQEIQQAYQVLSHGRKRSLYDMGLYEDDGEEEVADGLARFVQELSGLMAAERRGYSLEELWRMLGEIGGGSGGAAPAPWAAPRCHERPSKRSRMEMQRPASDLLGCMA